MSHAAPPTKLPVKVATMDGKTHKIIAMTNWNLETLKKELQKLERGGEMNYTFLKKEKELTLNDKLLVDYGIGAGDLLHAKQISKLPLKVHTMDGQTYLIMAMTNWDLAMLKKDLQEWFGGEGEKYALLYKGKELTEDNKLLVDYGFEKGDVLEAVKISKLPLRVRTIEGKTYNIRAMTNWSLETFKKELEQWCGEDYTKIIYKDDELTENKKLLVHYGILKGDLLDVIQTSKLPRQVRNLDGIPLNVNANPNCNLQERKKEPGLSVDQVTKVIHDWIRNGVDVNIDQMLTLFVNKSDPVHEGAKKLYNIMKEFNLDLQNMYAKYVCFHGERDQNQLDRFYNSACERSVNAWKSSGLETIGYNLFILEAFNLNRFQSYKVDNQNIIHTEKKIIAWVIGCIERTYKQTLEQILRQEEGFRLFPTSQVEEIQNRMLAQSLKVFQASTNYGGKLNNVVTEAMQSMEKLLKMMFDQKLKTIRISVDIEEKLYKETKKREKSCFGE